MGIELGEKKIPEATDDSRMATSDEEDWKDTDDGQPSPQTLARRTSVSLPNLEMLLRLQEQRDREERALGHPRDDSEVSDISDGSDDVSDEEEVVPTSRTPLRRKSKAPPPLNIVNSNFLKSEPVAPSPAVSTNSINSLSSLLKDRLVMTIPGVLKAKRPREYKLQAFVAFLFVAIVFLVGFAYVFYHQQVLQRAYFERIRFNQEERHVRVFDRGGIELLSGWLGVTLPKRAQGYPCLEGKWPRPGAVCIEWDGLARLSLHHHPGAAVGQNMEELRCYEIYWEGLGDTTPTDCFDMEERKGIWYGGGEAEHPRWPFSIEIKMSPFVTGDRHRQSWGNALQRYFLSSRGVALLISEDTPLYVSTYEQGEQLCLQARHDSFAYTYTKHPTPVLNYTVCTAADIRAVHSSLADKSLWDGLKDDEKEVLYNLLEEPVWRFSLKDKSQEALLLHMDQISSLSSLEQGYVLLDEYWQPQIGDLEVDTSRFKEMPELIRVLHRRGYKLAMTVQPFFDTDCKGYSPGVDSGIWIKERASRVPALTAYKSIKSGAVLDMTHNASAPWLQQRLVKVREELEVDAFFLDVGTAHDFPRYYEFHTQLPSPDHYSRLFVRAAMQVVPVLGVSSAIVRPKLPAVVAMSAAESSWEGLQALVPTLLTLGTVGYPIVMPGPIGGDYLPTNNTHNDTDELLPGRELYMRWLELAHFLPIIQYSYLPSEFGPEVEELARTLTRLRKSLINPIVKKFANESLDTGLPIIRPLWMLDPTDTNCLKIGDEFSIGDELIVAPILAAGVTEREIYLPEGVWKDGLDGSQRKGERWIHSYKVMEDQIAYFMKQPEGTRLL